MPGKGVADDQRFEQRVLTVKRGDKIDARKGTNLNSLCMLHSWMQGTIRVR
jgi:hypothetical protein